MYNNNPYMNNRGYQQFYPQYQQYQQHTYQQPEPQIQNIKYLNAEQIKAYIVMPNTKEVLVDNENNLAYVVSADNMGITTKKSFSFKSLDEPKAEEKKPEIDMSEYVKITDLDKFVSKETIKALEGKIALLEGLISKKDKINNQQGR